RVEVWVPGVFEVNIFTPEQIRNGASYLLAVARLKSGATLEQAQAELLLQRDQQQNPTQSKANPKVEIQAKLLQDSLVENVRTHLLVLWGVVGLVLLLVCVNTANLLLARAATRQKELAIRAALGTGRLRIVRQLFTESILRWSCFDGQQCCLENRRHDHEKRTFKIDSQPGKAGSSQTQIRRRIQTASSGYGPERSDGAFRGTGAWDQREPGPSMEARVSD